MPFPIANSGGGELEIDYESLGAIMRGHEIRGIVLEAAHEAAAALGSNPEVDRVWVNSYNSFDRAAAAITVPYWTADQELKYGLLADAARAAGLEVKMS